MAHGCVQDDGSLNTLDLDRRHGPEEPVVTLPTRDIINATVERDGRTKIHDGDGVTTTILSGAPHDFFVCQQSSAQQQQPEVKRKKKQRERKKEEQAGHGTRRNL
ncbi:hypothetical protein WN55_00212 [Dufourea novaeangliae]|uniref:Uncharacterized protein n=1 Tax=Dufourea novaeangliae TaxID=178035 RepID=A0A154PEA6_DUFNO|nr:hypothetical protein WN55_00212 [Dufourea novaeangliae]